MPELVLKNDQHIGALGRTGCGKTFLMNALLRDQPRVLVIDDKRRVNFKGYHLTSDYGAALLEDKIILRPNGKVPDSFWDDVLLSFTERGGGVIYIDELAEQTNPNHIPPGLATILRLGRELNVVVWWSAQAATEIANGAIRACQIVIQFLQIGASDRDKMLKITGDMAEVSGNLDLYEFVVFQAYNKTYDPDAIPVYKYVRQDPDEVTTEVTRSQELTVS